MERTFIEETTTSLGQEVRVCGWVHRLRVLKTAAFIVLTDCSGSAQIVATPEQVTSLGLKLEDVLEVTALVRAEPRASGGRELQWIGGRVLNRSRTCCRSPRPRVSRTCRPRCSSRIGR